MLTRFIREDEGATAIEYALIAALLAVAIIVTVTALGSQLNAVFTNVSNQLAPGTGS